MTALPTLPVTMVGSWPRPRELLRAQKLKRAGRIADDEFERQADQSVLDLLALEEEAGVDIVTDGEQRRDGFFSFVADKLDGVQLMTLAEMLELVEQGGVRADPADARWSQASRPRGSVCTSAAATGARTSRPS